MVSAGALKEPHHVDRTVPKIECDRPMMWIASPEQVVTLGPQFLPTASSYGVTATPAIGELARCFIKTMTTPRSRQDQVRRPDRPNSRDLLPVQRRRAGTRGKRVTSFGCGWSIAGLGGEWFGDIPLPSGRTESQIQRLQPRRKWHGHRASHRSGHSGISPTGSYRNSQSSWSTAVFRTSWQPGHGCLRPASLRGRGPNNCPLGGHP
jgi:hypothetical protein